MKLKGDTVFGGRYRLKHILGKGGFSEVWLAHDMQTGLAMAIKAGVGTSGELEMNPAKAFASEYALTFNLRHEHLLLPVFFEVYHDVPCLILPYCEGRSAGRLAGKLSEQEAWKMLRDIASALDYLHNQSPPLVHCDVKPGNILAGSDGKYLLADFGICQKIGPSASGASRKQLGTPAYMSPERFVRGSTPVKASDVFSLGATVYELISGSSPFGQKGGIRLHKGAKLLPLEGDFSAGLKKLIERCLSKDAWDRPSAAEVKSIATDNLADKSSSSKAIRLRLHLPSFLSRLDDNQRILAAWAAFAFLCIAIIACIALI
ncbi:MAG: serine/threonine protein kinase [Tannerellaceae bacterium]|jgi:serine/threonine protein kinase|nr:serine/threonine protein kinase [Tannerellaceae bacterium]